MPPRPKWGTHASRVSAVLTTAHPDDFASELERLAMSLSVREAAELSTLTWVLFLVYHRGGRFPLADMKRLSLEPETRQDILMALAATDLIEFRSKKWLGTDAPVPVGLPDIARQIDRMPISEAAQRRRELEEDVSISEATSDVNEALNMMGPPPSASPMHPTRRPRMPAPSGIR